MICFHLFKQPTKEAEGFSAETTGLAVFEHVRVKFCAPLSTVGLTSEQTCVGLGCKPPLTGTGHHPVHGGVLHGP